jgi:hypothetical protein
VFPELRDRVFAERLRRVHERRAQDVAKFNASPWLRYPLIDAARGLSPDELLSHSRKCEGLIVRAPSVWVLLAGRRALELRCAWRGAARVALPVG